MWQDCDFPVEAYPVSMSDDLHLKGPMGYLPPQELQALQRALRRQLRLRRLLPPTVQQPVLTPAQLLAAAQAVEPALNLERHREEEYIDVTLQPALQLFGLWVNLAKKLDPQAPLRVLAVFTDPHLLGLNLVSAKYHTRQVCLHHGLNQLQLPSSYRGWVDARSTPALNTGDLRFVPVAELITLQLDADSTPASSLLSH
jgi:hypothetical protein